MSPQRVSPKKEIAKFCEKYPWICEQYPKIKEYMKEYGITAEEMEKLVIERPEWISEIDHMTLKEALEKLREEEKEIQEFIKKHKPPKDIVEILKDPAIPMEVKKKVMEEYLISKELMIRAPKKKRVKPKPPEEIPKAPPLRLEIVGEEIRAVPIGKVPELYESRWDEIDTAKRLLKEQHGIEATDIDYIIKISDTEWSVLGKDRYGRSFYKIIRLTPA